eukprot:2455492-Lingulodinium_polyedra.AAC.1
MAIEEAMGLSQVSQGLESAEGLPARFLPVGWYRPVRGGTKQNENQLPFVPQVQLAWEDKPSQ